jgi:hypothetical protein
MARRKQARATSADSEDASGRTVSVPFSMSEELARKVAATAQKVGLAKQPTMRLALERGLPVLEAQLLGESEPATT